MAVGACDRNAFPRQPALCVCSQQEFRFAFVFQELKPVFQKLPTNFDFKLLILFSSLRELQAPSLRSVRQLLCGAFGLALWRTLMDDNGLVARLPKHRITFSTGTLAFPSSTRSVY